MTQNKLAENALIGKVGFGLCASAMSSGLRFLFRTVRSTSAAGVMGDNCKTNAISSGAMGHVGEETRVLKGVIFDMDGTLTVPTLNFLEMKRRIGLSSEADILPTVQQMPKEEMERAMKIIEECEAEGTDGWFTFNICVYTAYLCILSQS